MSDEDGFVRVDPDLYGCILCDGPTAWYDTVLDEPAACDPCAIAIAREARQLMPAEDLN